MNWKTISVTMILVIAVWSSTEITSPLYHVRLNANRSNITLSRFPYDVSGVSVSVPTSEYQCNWFVNETFDSTQYLYNSTNILLQPFGVNFTNTSVECLILETGTAYSLIIGDTCPSFNSTAVQSSLKAVPWLQGDVQINISFMPAVACNPELFPISHYFISIPGLAGNLTVPAVDSHTALSAALASSSFPRLVKESYYIINVQTCTAYVCGATPASVSVVTSDVQDANITFFRTTVSLYCVFAASGSARGCRFVLTLINGTWENIDLLRPTAGGTVSMKCAHTSHTRHNYIKIVVFDVRENSTSGNLPVLPHVVESDQIPCEEPTRQPNKPHKSNTTYLFILMLLLPISIAVFFCCCYWWYKRCYKRSGASTESTSGYSNEQDLLETYESSEMESCEIGNIHYRKDYIPL